MDDKQPQSSNPDRKLKEELRRIARDAGFDPVAFAAPKKPPHAHHLQKWLNGKQHGDMAWLANDPPRRMDPKRLMENLGSIMVLGLNYRPPGEASPYLSDPAAMGVSAYARNREYQTHIKKKLKKLARAIEAHIGRKIDGRIFVDTAPLMEKPIAAASGMGWQGKNSLLVNRQYGCWLFLAEFFLELNLPPDAPQREHCGSCDRCQRACPTNALDTPWQLAANRCLAYLSIESQGPIPHQFREAMGNRVFGCDDCITACPWNRFAPETEEAAFLPRPALAAPRLTDFAFMDEEEFRAAFSNSAIKRSGRKRFMRNLAIALGNWGELAALPALERLMADAEPLIRGHAAWGLARIDAPKVENLLTEAAQNETEQTVRDEIAMGLDYLRSRKKP